MSERPGPSSSAFRQQAINTANLLLEAATKLDDANNESSTPNRRDRTAFGPSNRTPSQRHVGSTTAVSAQPGTSVQSSEGELRGLFNWTSFQRGKGCARKRKTSNHAASSGSMLKKKKVVTWSHTYICLSHPYDDMAPGSSDRATLKLAGLGEKRVHDNVASTAQEFRDELHQEYPKLMDGGGFELLRVMEGGGKGLDVIQIPEAGYTPEYLKAVIHHAKIFILPLQKALDVQPQNTAVSYN